MSLEQSSNSSHEWKQRTIVSAIAAALTPGMASVVQAQDQNEANDNRLEEVIVSARKREENIQDIPQSIQAFSQDDITKVGITNLKDLAKFVPAMTVVGSSSGFNKIIFRGVADSPRPFIADSSAAIYLDEQPLTTGAQSPEIRPYDLARIETLAGPQGTLYGASSQSGTVRYIVNKPDASHFAGNVGGGMNYVHSGEIGWDADAMMNIPLIEDQLAIRLVAFGGKDPGYIDNVYGNTPGRIDPETDEHIQGSKTNQAIVENNINSTPFKGLRASVKWLLNDDWAVTGIYNYSDSRVNGYNDYDPTKGDLKTVKFYKESWDDNWNNFQLTIDGDLNGVLLTSSTSYFERDTAYVFDGTSGVAYYHSVLGAYGYGTCGTEANPYYQAYNIYDFSTACALNGTGYDVDDADPSGFNRNDQRDTRWTHETRFTGNTGRWFWTAGVFYQQAKQHWAFGTAIDGYPDTQSFAAYNTIYGMLEPTDIRWSSDERNKRTDWAIFGEATVDLSDKWKMLVGLRWYDAQIDRTYTLKVPATGPADISTPSGSDSGFLPKLGFQYFFEPDKMLYALYSEGFRTGGINRARGNPTLPVEYGPDLLNNYEAGLKSQWMDGSLQFNLIGYHQVWKDMQNELTDPSYSYGEPYQTVIANVGDAVIDGFDLEIFYQANEHVQLGWTSTYLFNAKIKDDIQVYDDRDPDDLALDLPGGTRLPLTADLNFSAFAEYDWQTSLMGGSQAYVRLQTSYTGDSYNRLLDADTSGTGNGARVKQPHYNTWDLRAGLSNSDWEYTFYLDNMFDKRGVSFISTNADYFWGRQNHLVIQPRTLGFRVKRYFN
jgi:outer membrane receptor protein involved in Fe transport